METFFCIYLEIFNYFFKKNIWINGNLELIKNEPLNIHFIFLDKSVHYINS